MSKNIVFTNTPVTWAPPVCKLTRVRRLNKSFITNNADPPCNIGVGYYVMLTLLRRTVAVKVILHSSTYVRVSHGSGNRAM